MHPAPQQACCPQRLLPPRLTPLHPTPLPRRSQQAQAVYNKSAEITTCTMGATAEKFCVSNYYCVWTNEKDSPFGYATCESR